MTTPFQLLQTLTILSHSKIYFYLDMCYVYSGSKLLLLDLKTNNDLLPGDRSKTGSMILRSKYLDHSEESYVSLLSKLANSN